jgi:hypothetical protein
MRRVVTVNDKMQQGCRYELSALGRPRFRPEEQTWMAPAGAAGAMLESLSGLIL